MSLIRWLAKILLWTVIAMVVLAGALLLVNAVDEDLRPETAAALNSPPQVAPEQDNAFFVLVGFHVPPGEDPHAAGRRQIAELAGANPSRPLGFLQKPQPGRLDFAGFKGQYCRPVAESCFDKARNDAAGVRGLIELNSELLKRYESMSRYPRMADILVARMDAPIPSFGALLNAQSLKLAEIALMIEAGRIPDAIEALERELAFQRRFSADSSSMVALMIAQVALSNDYLFVSDLMRARREALAPHAARIAGALGPAGGAGAAFAPVFGTEFRFSASMTSVVKEGRAGEMYGKPDIGVLNVLSDPEKLFTGEARGLAFLDPFVLPFLKPQATLNFTRAYYQRLAELSRSPARRVGEELRTLQEQVQSGIYNWKIVYNPLGKLLVARAFDNVWNDYFYRVHDVDSLARLVALQVRIVEKGIADSDVPGFLASGDKALFDPYTEKPMQWDAAARQLWFEPRSPWGKRDKIGGREGRIAVGL
jgi:hypothetical protein